RAAIPVDGALDPDQCRRVQVPDKAVLGDRQISIHDAVKGDSIRCSWTVPRVQSGSLSHVEIGTGHVHGPDKKSMCRRSPMARIQGVPQNQAGPVVKLVYRFMRRGTKKLTGRDAAHGSGIEPIEIWAYQPKMMSGMGKFQGAVRKGSAVDERLKYLVELKGAQMIGCEFCVDLGSQICRNSGFSDDELLALPRYNHSDLFTEREKLALDYTVAVMRTPVEVTDDLFERMKEHFSE